jgi:hypothetical protein
MFKVFPDRILYSFVMGWKWVDGERKPIIQNGTSHLYKWMTEKEKQKKINGFLKRGYKQI